MKYLLAVGVFPPEIGGPASVVSELALTLRAQGHDVTVVTYGDTPSEDGIVRVPRNGSVRHRYARFSRAVRSHLSNDMTVLATDVFSVGIPVRWALRGLRNPLVVRLGGEWCWEDAVNTRRVHVTLREFWRKGVRGWQMGLMRTNYRWILRRATTVVLTSEILRNIVTSLVPNISKRIIVVPNHSSFPVKPPSNRLPSAPFRILYVGRFEPVRNVPFLGRVAYRLHQRGVPVAWTFVGDGSDLEATKRETKDVPNVTYLGRVPHERIAQLLRENDVVAVPSLTDVCPNIAVEALASGVPVFITEQHGLTPAGGMVELSPLNEEKWVDAIVKYINDPAAFVSLRSTIRLPDPSPVSLSDVIVSSPRRQTTIVGYERELLERGSDAASRLTSLAGEDWEISSLILSGGVLDASVDHDHVRAVGFSGRAFRRMFRAWREGVRIVRQHVDANIVSGQDPFAAGVVAYCISRWTNVPLEIQEHGDFFSGAWVRESWKNRMWSCAGKMILRRAEHVRVVSERVKEHVVRLGVREECVDVIPVSQDLGALFDLPIRHHVGDVFRIVVPCRFVHQKGLDILLRAASILKTKGRRFHISIIGRGPLEADLRQRISIAGLSGEVSIEPWTDIRDLLSSADLFVMSSRYEGWGRTIVEAMAAGVPVVTTTVGCVGSFFRQGQDGLAVAPDDANALARAMDVQMTDASSRERMQTTARAHAKEFPEGETLHASQRRGWNALIDHAPSNDVGPRWDLWVLAFLAFAIMSRAASVILFHSGLQSREHDFFRLVESWFQGYGYSFAHQLGCPSAYRSPGYLFFLTGLYFFFSPNNTWAQAIAQNLVVVGVLWLVYAVGKQLAGKRAALIGGFLMAAYPYTFYHYTQYYHTFLSSFFLLLIVWFLLRLRTTKRLMFAFGAGVSIACMAYVQGTILPATPFMVGWLLFVWWPDWRTTLKAAIIMAVVSAGMIAPWTYRNWVAFHHFVPLTTDLGQGMFEANNENIYELTKRGYPQEVVDVIIASSTNPNYQRRELQPQIADELARDHVLRPSIISTQWHPVEPTAYVDSCSKLGPLNEAEYDMYWKQLAMARVTDHWWPDGFKLQLLKIRTFWQPALFPSVKMGADWTFVKSPMKVWLARNSVTAAASVVIFGGFIGLLLAIRRRDRTVWLPVILFTVYTLLHSIFAGYTKYRIPLDNLMAVYAGASIVAVWDWIRGKRPPIL